MMNVAAPPPAPPRRRWRRWLLVIPAAVVLLVAAAPTLLSNIPALQRWLVAVVVGPLNGTVTVEQVRAGWFEQVVITGVRVAPPTGEPALAIERIESDRSLWRLVTSLRDMGTLRIERPTAYIEFREGGTNWHELMRVPPSDAAPRGKKQGTPLDLGVRAQIVDGTLRGKSTITGEPWEIPGINLGVGLRAAAHSPSGKQELLVDAGTLLRRGEISVGLCDDVLKYAAPTLAKVASARGLATIELDDWRLPVDDFAAGQLSGRLTMHTVDVGPGAQVRAILARPLIAEAVAQLNLPPFVQLARESTIPFSLVERRIYHEHLRFSLADLVDVETKGFVGFDESLEMTAVFGIHPPNPENRKLAAMRVLTTQPWPIKIGGKLGAPQVDDSPLKGAGIDLVLNALGDMQAGNDSVGARIFQSLNDRGLNLEPADIQFLIQKLRESNAQQTQTPPSSNPPPSNPSTANSPTTNHPQTTDSPADAASPKPPIDGGQLALDILDALRARREARLRPPPGAPYAPPPTAEEPPVRRPLLRQGLRLLLEPPPPPPAPSPPPAPTGTLPRP